MACKSGHSVPLVQSIHLCGGVSDFGHRTTRRLLAQDNLVQGKPPSGWGRSCGELHSEGPSQRTQRCRLGFAPQLEVRASPLGNQAMGIGPNHQSPAGVRLDVGYRCDALRCSGPHARYTDKVSEFIL